MNNFHPLGRLMQDAMDRNNWSLRELERRTEAVGQRMSHTNLGRIKDDPITSIKGDVIKLLSQILNVPEYVVSAAALESMGVAVASSSNAAPLEDVVRTSQEISEYDQELLGALIHVMKKRATNEATTDPDTQHSAPTDLGAVRERRHGQAIGSGQKTPDPELTPPAFEDLAAHPYFKLQAEKNDEYFDGLGEEPQDHGDDHA